MKWWLELLDFFFFFICANIGFRLWNNYAIIEWQWWAFSLPLVIAGHLGVKWCVKKNYDLEENKEVE